MTAPADVRRARTAFWWVGVIVPLVILVLSTAVVVAWWAELPDPVAMHWSGSAPDGFGPRWTILIPPLIGAALVALFAVMALFAHRLPPQVRTGGGVVTDADGTPQWSLTARFLGAVSLGQSAMMGFLTIATAHVQRGLADAQDAAGIGPWVLVGFVLLVVLTAVGWFLQPRVVSAPARAAAPGAAPLAPTERAAWFGSVTIARSGIIVLSIGVLVVLVMTVITLARGDQPAMSAILVALSLGLLFAVAASTSFRVRVDERGLRVRALVGWPDTRIALADITAVGVVKIDPFAEFGGWGWRLGTDGRRGVVLRKGDALQVTRGNGRVFVVTVDGAADAASVLESLRTRAQTH